VGVREGGAGEGKREHISILYKYRKHEEDHKQMLLLEMTVVVMYKILLLRLSEVGEQSI
jgi:hypothetical protein